MNAIFMWIGEAIWFLVKSVGLIALGVWLFAQIWPYIADLVKFFAIAIPAVIVCVLWSSGEIVSAIVVLVIGVVVVAGLWLIFRFLDRECGVLMTEDEAREKGYL